MVKIDQKDRKILYELSKNCRIPLSTLSKKVALKREVVDYRIKRLIKQNVIVDFITEIDESKLGFNRYLIYFTFQNVDEAKEKELINYIVNNPFVAWTTTSTGKWSIIFDLIAENVHEVNGLIDEIKANYKDFIDEYLIVPQISFEHFNSKYYMSDEDKKTKKTMENIKPKKLKHHKTDNTDLKLLKILSNNARIGYVELSKLLKLSPNAIKNRIKALENARIINSFYIHPNKTLLGYEQYYLQLDFVNQTKEEEKQIINYIRQHPNMNAYYKPLGHWSIEVAVFVRNPGELRKIILELRNKFGNIMKVHDTMLFYEEPKSNYLPKGVFKEQ